MVFGLGRKKEEVKESTSIQKEEHSSESHSVQKTSNRTEVDNSASGVKELTGMGTDEVQVSRH